MANLIMRKARSHSSRLRPCGIRHTHPNSDRFLSVYHGANFGYCLLRPPHGRFSPDCVTVARWMNILACFMCSFSEKYPTADTTGAALEFISRMYAFPTPNDSAPQNVSPVTPQTTEFSFSQMQSAMQSGMMQSAIQPGDNMQSAMQPGVMQSAMQPGVMQSALQPDIVQSVIQPGMIQSTVQLGMMQSTMQPSMMNQTMQPVYQPTQSMYQPQQLIHSAAPVSQIVQNPMKYYQVPQAMSPQQPLLTQSVAPTSQQAFPQISNSVVQSTFGEVSQQMISPQSYTHVQSYPQVTSSITSVDHNLPSPSYCTMETNGMVSYQHPQIPESTQNCFSTTDSTGLVSYHTNQSTNATWGAKSSSVIPASTKPSVVIEMLTKLKERVQPIARCLSSVASTSAKSISRPLSPTSSMLSPTASAFRASGSVQQGDVTSDTSEPRLVETVEAHTQTSDIDEGSSGGEQNFATDDLKTDFGTVYYVDRPNANVDQTQNSATASQIQRSFEAERVGADQADVGEAGSSSLAVPTKPPLVANPVNFEAYRRASISRSNSQCGSPFSSRTSDADLSARLKSLDLRPNGVSRPPQDGPVDGEGTSAEESAFTSSQSSPSAGSVSEFGVSKQRRTMYTRLPAQQAVYNIDESRKNSLLLKLLEKELLTCVVLTRSADSLSSVDAFLTRHNITTAVCRSKEHELSKEAITKFGAQQVAVLVSVESMWNRICKVLKRVGCVVNYHVPTEVKRYNRLIWETNKMITFASPNEGQKLDDIEKLLNKRITRVALPVLPPQTDSYRTKLMNGALMPQSKNMPNNPRS
eukprot:669386_1